MSKYEDILKERVKKRVRPFQYLILHIFAMVTSLILMGIGTEYNLVSEGAIALVAILFVITLIAHIFWRGSDYLSQRIEWEEETKLLNAEKPKHDFHRLEDDGELLDYNDYSYKEKPSKQKRLNEML